MLKTPQHRARAAYWAMRDRAQNANGHHPTYADIECRISRNAFIAWYKSALPGFFQKFAGETPSVDRIVNDGHYELSNLRLIPHAENSRLKASNHNVNAPSGLSWCGCCQQYKSLSDFANNRSQPNGLCNRCKSCYKANRIIS